MKHCYRPSNSGAISGWLKYAVLVIIAVIVLSSMIFYTQSSPHATMPGIHRATKGRSLISSHGLKFSSKKRPLTQNIGKKQYDVFTDRLQKCLDGTNMTKYFHQRQFQNTAMANMKRYLDILHSYLPRNFSSIHVLANHCWKAEAKLSLGSSKISGRIGETDFLVNRTKLSTDEVEHMNTMMSQRMKNYHLPFSCIPKVFLSGFPKCGSTYLYALLTSHPHIPLPLDKEPHWWPRNEHFSDIAAVNTMYLVDYLMNFKTTITRLQNRKRALAVDATPSLMFDWPNFPQQNEEINFCLLPAVIPEILPRAKFIVVMRNPISMLYSAFWFSCTHRHQSIPRKTQLKGPDIFHKRILMKINTFNSCSKAMFPLPACVMAVSDHFFTPELPNCGRTRLEMGIYYVHIKKWLSVVSRKRFLFFTLEELSLNIDEAASKLWRFLEIPSFPMFKKVLEARRKAINEQETVDYRHDPRLAMRNDTRQLLQQFFRPYNQMLADLLDDKKFLWEI